MRYGFMNNRAWAKCSLFVPMPGTTGEKWISARRLLRDKFDDTTDPKGLIRKAQTQFLNAKKAFLANNAADFNSATKALLAVVREIGEPTKDYPTEGIIKIEVAYNRWAPFRFAWICCAAALVLSLTSIFTGRRTIYRIALTLFTAGFDRGSRRLYDANHNFRPRRCD